MIDLKKKYQYMFYNVISRSSKRFNKKVASCWSQEKNFYKGCVRTFILSHRCKYLYIILNYQRKYYLVTSNLKWKIYIQKYIYNLSK